MRLSTSDSVLPFSSVDYSDNRYGYPFIDYVPIDAGRALDNDDILNKFIFSLGYSLPASEVNEYLGYDRFEGFGFNIGIHEFYPVYYVNEGLTPTYYYQEFENPFWNETPYSTQYWFYYVNNIWVQNHISDWEAIAYFSNAERIPTEATYSTHYEANKRVWNEVQINNSAPLVFISNGGHGSYFDSGTTSFTGFTDYHYGNREAVQAGNVLSLMDTGNGRTVLEFAGLWGAAGDRKAPHGPRLRFDREQTLLDNTLAKNPYNGCANYADLGMYGTSTELPAYGEPIVENASRARSSEVRQELIDHGPFRWSSGYFTTGECASISTPVRVEDLMVEVETDLAISWKDPSFAGDPATPFGYVVSVYEESSPKRTKCLYCGPMVRSVRRQ